MIQELFATGAPERVLDCPETAAQYILAIDTSVGTSVALSNDGQVFEVTSDDPRGHAEAIGPLITQVFEMSELAPERVTAVVVGYGPGPFTGLRVGIAAGQGFAVGRGAPLHALHGHEAAALAVFASAETSVVSSHETREASSTIEARARCVQDAKRRELFVSEYAFLDAAGLPILVQGAHIVERAAFEESQYDVWPERIPAARLVQLAARRIAAGREFERNEALYLRQPDVAAPGAPKRVST